MGILHLRNRIQPFATHCTDMLTVCNRKSVVGPFAQANLLEYVDTGQLTHETDWLLIRPGPKSGKKQRRTDELLRSIAFLSNLFHRCCTSRRDCFEDTELGTGKTGRDCVSLLTDQSVMIPQAANIDKVRKWTHVDDMVHESIIRVLNCPNQLLRLHD